MNKVILYRKKHLVKSMLLIAALLLSSLSVSAQVTIGSSEEALSGALLQLKEKDNVTDSTLTAYKGIALPRVTLTKKNELYPMFLATPTDATSGPNAAYTANKATLDKTHTGLFVYNLTANEDEELNVGLNQWDGTQWNSFEQKAGVAQFDKLACANIVVSGSYIEGVEMNSGNYITLTTNVTRIGTYSITITTPNGYNFSVSDVALSTGALTILVPAQGTPTASGTDNITVSGINLADASCLPTITVSPPTATYAIACDRITVNGVYEADVALTASNSVSMYVTVTKATAKAGNYTITTNTIDGLYYKAQGSWSAPGTYLVTLQAYGTVDTSKEKTFTITTDSQGGSDNCQFTVTPVIPYKTTYTYGDTPYVISNTPQRNMLQSASNFGPNGTVKYKGFTSTNLVARGSSNATMIADLASSTPPDIIHVSYPMSVSAAGATAIADYAKKGGVVIITIENATIIQNIINGLFGITNADASVATPDNAAYVLPTSTTDPIIAGPFGNLSGKNFAWDGCCNRFITNVPTDSVFVYASDNYLGNTTVREGTVSGFRHKTLNVLFFADGGTFSSSNTSATYYPVAVGASTAYKPIAKTYTAGGTTTSTLVYNSFMLCNAMAWAVVQAQNYGINSANYK